MAVKIFLLGRPGSGKTSAYYILEKIARKKKKRAIRFREYTILLEMIQQDDFKDKFRIVEFGGFDILDPSVFDESSKRLEERIETYLTKSSAGNENELIFIELARDDYSKAMNCFSRKFLKDAYFLFTDADIETCIERIHYRVAHPKKTDGHYVSDFIVKSYYSMNNFPYMYSKFRLEYGIQKYVMVIKNTDSLKDYAKLINYFAKVIFTREFNNYEETVLREFGNPEENSRIYIQMFIYSLLLLPLILYAIPTCIQILSIFTRIPLFVYILLTFIFFAYQNLCIQFSEYEKLRSSDGWDSTQLWKSPSLWEIPG